jgi:hypothetical protein
MANKGNRQTGVKGGGQGVVHPDRGCPVTHYAGLFSLPHAIFTNCIRLFPPVRTPPIR